MKTLYIVTGAYGHLGNVVVRLLASLSTGWLYLVAIAAYVLMLVYYGKAAWAYDRRNPYQPF